MGALFNTVLLVFFMGSFLSGKGVQTLGVLRVTAMAWGYVLVWLGCIVLAPACYHRHRTAIAVFVRLCMGLVAAQTTTDLRHLMHETGIIPGRPGISVLLKLVFSTHAHQTPFEVFIVTLPMWQQAAVLAAKGAFMLLSGGTLELIGFFTDPRYAAGTRHVYTALSLGLQPSAPLGAGAGARLSLAAARGLDCAPLQLVAFVHVLTTGLWCYAYYFYLWQELRLWLQHKLDGLAAPPRMPRLAAPRPEPAPDVLVVKDVAVTAAQLRAAHSTTASALLLDRLHGPLPMVALHAVGCAVVVQVAWAVSHVAVWVVFPALVPRGTLATLCPAVSQS